MRYHVYLAGPFFTREQKAVMDEAKQMLEKFGLVVCDPRDLNPVISDLPPVIKRPAEFYKKIFQGNVIGIGDSFSIIAWTDIKDTGTAFELGVAWAMIMPIITFSTMNMSSNVMLAQAAGGHFKSLQALGAFISANLGMFEAEQDIELEQALAAVGKAEANE